jgi:hypothetical protein
VVITTIETKASKHFRKATALSVSSGLVSVKSVRNATRYGCLTTYDKQTERRITLARKQL